MNFIRAIFRSSKEVKKLVGTDYLGNKYYEIPEDAKVLGEKLKQRRFVESNISHYEYKPGMIPYEWEAWIRGNRKDPPTPEEIAKRENQTLKVQQLAKALEEKEAQVDDVSACIDGQQKPFEDVTKHVEGHAKSEGHTSTSEIGSKSDAASTENVFKPTAWQPGKKGK
ncbi:NADH dehydrogenase [ubiquinone] 1 alpha subcomplex assembly factor 2-like [Anneissia japonica]|uniref:NADH dehydrogenase [ubiquinone] 1 alpha subcomplex assembly factor 2-like n=1 Tax=Anneissia japonica TaxID=1529436 RepID=UPI0014257FEB|nr:NADH dehydrogenase [ubiquinone] 1 alpha subcomplex assembly factor 2-like [Anneissia japonica]